MKKRRLKKSVKIILIIILATLFILANGTTKNENKDSICYGRFIQACYSK